MVMPIFGVALRPNREFMDGRKNEPPDSANMADLISQGKYLFYEYPE
jgi:transposase